MPKKEEIIVIWNKAGGLITKKLAADILGVNKSVLSKRKDIETYKIGSTSYVSYHDIINREDIKPRNK